MSPSAARHETRALLRAHLAAASGYRHLTRHCAVCHRLLRLAMEPGDSGDGADRRALPGPSDAPQTPAGRPGGNESGDEGPGGGRSGERTGDERPSAT